MNQKALVEAAFAMLPKAYAPYSHFHVGAALLTKDGEVFTGCNVENASYGAAICAERTAFVKAVSEGKREFQAIAVVGGREGAVTDFTPPCGICRQVMAEFGGPDFQILLAKSPEEIRCLTLAELLPEAFGGAQLEKEDGSDADV